MLSLADGRHFKAVYGKDFVESLLTSSDFLMAEREKSADDQLAAQRNQSTSLQGQINLMRSHQAQQDQRISFALAQEAEVMLMDEPLAHLDPPHQADWIALVRELVAAGRTVVSVLHEISLALMADDVLVLRDGRLSHAGPAHDPAAHAALLQAFDGRLAIVHVDAHWVALPR